MQYDSSVTYGKNRDSTRTSSVSTDRPTTVTAKYTSTPSYKSSSIPVLNDRSTREETPISTIANRYASYSKTTTADKPTSKYEKKDYSKLSVPSLNTTRSRDVSPVPISKYSINRTSNISRQTSPERRTAKNFKEKGQDLSPADRDKDIPIKTDKTTNYSSLSNYKLYPRTPSYSKPNPTTRVDSKPEVTVNRYAIANRLASSSYLRSPTPIKRTSVSPINHLEIVKPDNERHKITNSIVEEKVEKNIENNTDCTPNGTEVIIDEDEDMEKVSVITRHTSPTPPGSSAYVRMRRADMAKTVEKIITRARKRPEMIDKEIQSDRLDDPTRTSRFGSTSRTSMTNWTYYSPNSTTYTGYAGRYSTQYSNLRENCSNDRSSRSRSKEPVPTDNKNSNIEERDAELSITTNHVDYHANEGSPILEQKKDDDTSEIIINVNLKLKKSSNPQSAITSTELLTPEITVTNNHQLPPQPPKSESTSKIKKTKIRKSSTDSSSDSTSSKKGVKKRSKSVSSTDSDQSCEKSNKSKNSNKTSSKGLNRTSSTTNISNGPSKLKYSKSRESNSPESSITLSTQSSISEDETVLKSKTIDVTETSVEPKNEGTEEAKSFLIRALAPVTNLFKLRHHDNTETTRLIDSSNSSESPNKDTTNLLIDNGSTKNNTNNIIASNDDSLVKLKAIRPIESGDRSWWIESDVNKKKINDKEKRQESCNENQSLLSNTTETNDSKVPLRLNCFADDEKPWWLDSNANIPEGIERLTPPRKSSSDSDKSEKFNFFKIRQNESGDRKDWRLASNDNTQSINRQDSQNSLSLSKSGSDQRNFQLRRIRHIESGERPWWLSSDKNIPEGIEKLPTPPPQPDSDSSDSEEVQVYIPTSQIPPFPLHLPDDEPLGDRRSPEGLETPNHDYRIGRSSPYENNRQYRRDSVNLPYQKGSEKYISRYTDIDDILGTSGHIYSPFMDSILARRTGQLSFDDDECEEIDPTQVRIHDSTAQMPVIKKLRSR